MIPVKKIYSILLLLFVGGTVTAQSEDVIMKAMKDELDRSMKELSMEGFEKPFYIAYTLDDRRYYTIMAQMGSLVRSTETPSRSSNVRLLVGDYSMNDETFDGNSGGGSQGNDVPMPVDNDYHGIRRSFWAMTDNVYKGAARQYKQNKQTLVEQKKPLEEVPHRSFAKLPPVEIIETVTPVNVNLKAMEKFATDVSAAFLQYIDLDNSAVYLYTSSGYKYFINTEGTMSRVPVQMASIYATASYQTPEGETLNDEIVYYAFTPEKLPSKDVVVKDIDVLYKRLKSKEKRGMLDDDYTGPILFSGRAVGELISQAFSNNETLFATDVLPNPKKRYYNEDASTENKLNKGVIHESLSIKARPRLKEYRGVPLLGAYPIDDDGVVPPEEIVLVENGVLKNLLNDRTLVKPYEVANGHRDGLSVLEVTTSKGVKIDALKQKLIERGKSDGLDYVLMVTVPDNSDGAVRIVTRIDVKDGREEVIRGANIAFFSIKDLKKVGGATDELQAANFTSRSNAFFSVIAPQALIINNVEVRKTTPSFFKEDVYVTNPLLK